MREIIVVILIKYVKGVAKLLSAHYINAKNVNISIIANHVTMNLINHRHGFEVFGEIFDKKEDFEYKISSNKNITLHKNTNIYNKKVDNIVRLSKKMK